MIKMIFLLFFSSVILDFSVSRVTALTCIPNWAFFKAFQLSLLAL
jgi:hypothetical protein